MAQPARIELQAGPDWAYGLMVCAAWLLAVITLTTQIHTRAWPGAVSGCLLLLWLWPGRHDPLWRSGRLSLYRDGTAMFGEQAGTWSGQAWTCRWYILLRLDLLQGTERVLICASCNTGHDYRRLRVWTRFAPFDSNPETRRPVQS